MNPFFFILFYFINYQAFNLWLNIPEDKLIVIGDLVEMLHNASLLIDDIQDNSKLRRGVPVAHNIYGVPLTINAANYIYFLAMQKALTLHHPDVTQIFVGLFN
jgi:geranylgeranyl diphosphate synthase type 3